MPAAALRHPRVRPEPASKERVVKLRQKMSAGNRRVLFVPLAASFLWARILVKKWTRSAAAQRARRPCPAGLKLALGQGEHVASRSSGSRFAESPGAQGPGGSTPDPPATPQGMPRNAPWRHHPSRPQRERRPPPPPPPQTDTGSPAMTPGPGRRFLRKQRDRGAPGASICASPVVRYRTVGCAALSSEQPRDQKGARS
jgi:hypothetical protein